MKKYFFIFVLCINSVLGGDCGSFSWGDSQRSVFPSIVGRPRTSVPFTPDCETQWKQLFYGNSSTVQDFKGNASPKKKEINTVPVKDFTGADQPKKHDRHAVLYQKTPTYHTHAKSGSFVLQKAEKRDSHISHQKILKQPSTSHDQYKYAESVTSVVDGYKEASFFPLLVKEMQDFPQDPLNIQGPLNQKGLVFVEDEIVVTWDGNRQKGRDKKMGYL